MPDREKVIKGLNYCAASCKCAWDENNGCPYMGDFIELGPNYNGRCVDLLCADALALLKAQEPRVMTLGEVVNASGTPAWFEGRSKRAYTGWVLVYDVQEGMGITGTRVGVTKPGHITIWPATELYGAKWRCWTSSPTDAQREAVPWMT